MDRRRTPRRASLRIPLGAGGADEEVVAIERIAAGGDGVGRLEDGRTVFVPRTAPGDVARVASIRRQKRFARASLTGIETPGAGRVEPRCPHYTRDRCGGCQLQHLDGASQRAARRSIVGDALRRVGRLDLPDPPLHAAGSEWRYRARITLHQGMNGAIGFHRMGQAGQVFQLEDCHVARPELMDLWARVGRSRSLLPRSLDTLTLRIDRAGAVHVLVRGTEAAWPGALPFAEALAPAIVWWRPPGGAARVVGGGTAFPATVFEQVNPAMGDRARARAIEWLGAVQGQQGWDLYAGIGETSDILAAMDARIESVELDRRAVDLATGRNRDPRIVRHAAAVEAVIATLTPPDFVVVNPPRTGMDGAVVDAIAMRRPSRLAYISCDPATLARDLHRLGDGFRVRALEAFDLFPQTAHVETVTLVEPA